MTDNSRNTFTVFRAAAAGLLALALAACATPQSETAESRDRVPDNPQSMADFMLFIREHPATRDAGAEYCAAQVASNRTSFIELAPLMSTMLHVARDDSGDAFCRAIVEAVVSNEFTEADIRALDVPRSERDYRVLGRFFRSLIIAHERLGAQQAQKPPQAQSCGCGQ